MTTGFLTIMVTVACQSRVQISQNNTTGSSQDWVLVRLSYSTPLGALAPSLISRPSTPPVFDLAFCASYKDGTSTKRMKHNQAKAMTPKGCCENTQQWHNHLMESGKVRFQIWMIIGAQQSSVFGWFDWSDQNHPKLDVFWSISL